MFCPRCGTENQDGDRFCSSCGAALGGAEKSAEPRSARDTLGKLIGTSRKARLVTAGTVLAVVVAIVAFIALKPSEEEETIPRDAYTVKADKLCIASKQAIVAIETQYAKSDAVEKLATELVPVVAAWRTQLSELTVPPEPAGRAELAAGLEAALLETEAQLGGLARVAKSGDTKEVVAKAKSVDAATGTVEEAASALGLTECEEATIGFETDKG
jgi:hypothetical protein